MLGDHRVGSRRRPAISGSRPGAVIPSSYGGVRMNDGTGAAVPRRWLRALSALLACVVLAAPASARLPTMHGTGGAVASTSDLASRSAISILDQGGNAVDAAIAAAATLGVTDPFSCGIGGGGFMLVYLAKERRVVALDHRETA